MPEIVGLYQMEGMHFFLVFPDGILIFSSDLFQTTIMRKADSHERHKLTKAVIEFADRPNVCRVGSLQINVMYSNTAFLKEPVYQQG